MIKETIAYGVYYKNELLSVHLKRKYAQGELLNLKGLDIKPRIVKVVIQKPINNFKG